VAVVRGRVTALMMDKSPDKQKWTEPAQKAGK
jgi:hypothetical protein